MIYMYISNKLEEHVINHYRRTCDKMSTRAFGYVQIVERWRVGMVLCNTTTTTALLLATQQ